MIRQIYTQQQSYKISKGRYIYIFFHPLIFIIIHIYSSYHFMVFCMTYYHLFSFLLYWILVSRNLLGFQRFFPHYFDLFFSKRFLTRSDANDFFNELIDFLGGGVGFGTTLLLVIVFGLTELFFALLSTLFPAD